MLTARPRARRPAIALAACGMAAAAFVSPLAVHGRDSAKPYDPVLDATGPGCAPARAGPPPLLRSLVRVTTETAPFQPAPMKAASGDVPLYRNLGALYFGITTANRKAIAVDESYFKTSPSDPLYRSAYYPHNIHFVMVSAQMGGDGRTAMEAAAKLDAALPLEVVLKFEILQPVKAAPYTTHAQFAAPEAVLGLPAPAPGLVLVQAMYHYARATAYAARRDVAGARQEIAAIEGLEAAIDFKPFEPWGIPAKAMLETARWVATGRLADAAGDLAAAAAAYESAIRVEDALAYTEPPYWYYPVRQSLGSVLLRQGRLAEAESAFRDSLARVRNNGWALAGLAEVYRRKGDADALAATRQRFAKAWFGPAAGPDLARL